MIQANADVAREEKQRKRVRPRGTGAIFQVPGSRFLWIGYTGADGRYKRESAKTERPTEAQRILRDRLAKVTQGEPAGQEINRALVRDLAEPLLADYRINRKSVSWAERCWEKHLEPFFGQMQAVRVSTDRLNQYIEKRRAESAANGTINRELSILQRMFTLAYEAQPRKVAQPLRFHRLAESAPRAGFVEEADYRKLLEKAAEPWLRAMLACAYSFGFRKSELLGMRVRQVDLLGRTIRLEPGSTKNGEGRTVVMTEEVYRLLGPCVGSKQPDDYLFTCRGKPVGDLRRAWAKLTVASGLTGLLVHDLRRSAVRNMVRRGIPEAVAMKISGHKTRAVFDRYNIVSESDLADAARRIEGGEIQSSFIAGTNSRQQVEAQVAPKSN